MRTPARTQRATSLWWRWAALPPGTRLHAEGTASPEGAEVDAVAFDAGRWQTLHTTLAAGGARIAIDLPVGRADRGAAARLGVLMRAGGARWERLGLQLPAPQGGPPHPLVLVTLDTTRRDALSVYAPLEPAPGDVARPPATHRTPALDSVARAGVRFELAYAPTPATAPSHATMLLSRLPAEHGLTVNGLPLPEAGAGHLATRLQAWGYATAAFVSLGVVDRHARFDTGFDTFDDSFDVRWWRFADEVNQAAVPWIRAHPQRPGTPPGFVWVHYSDPHHPYGMQTDRGRGLVARLDGAVLDTLATAGGMPWKRRLELGPGRHVLRFEAPALAATRAFDGDARQGWKGARYAVWSLMAEGQGVVWERGQGWQTQPHLGFQEAAEVVLDVRATGAPGQRAACAVQLVCSDVVAPEIRRRRYWDEVAAMDRAFGALWQALQQSGWLDEGAVIVAGDHGEDLGEEGRWGHVHHLGSTLVRVPLLMWGNGIAARVERAPVSLADIPPTLVAWSGLAIDPSWTGIDLLAPRAERTLFLETFPPQAHVHRRAVVANGFQLGGVVPPDGGPLRNPSLFDLCRDPYCRVDLLPILDSNLRRKATAGRAVPDTAGARAAWSALEPVLANWQAGAAPGALPSDPALMERLRALGYVQ